MHIVHQSAGNINDSSWASRLKGFDHDPLLLDQWQAQKNRFRMKSKGGVEIAVALERNTHLRDGDILYLDEQAKLVVFAKIELQDVLVIELGGLLAKNQNDILQTCFELGHALGNQHWPAIVKGAKVYVPLTVDRKVMASVMRTHAFEGITHEFHAGREIIPYLLPHEARQLFGGADSTPHSHLNKIGTSPTHSHVDSSGVAFTHAHGKSEEG